MKEIEIRRIDDADHEWVKQLMVEHWGSLELVTRGRIHQGDKLPGFMAWFDKKRMGLLTFWIENGSCEIVTLNSLKENIGVGTALIDTAKKTAIDSGCSRLWLITTNDNEKAIQFYRNYGFTLYAVHENAIDESRKIKPEIPLLGLNDIPITDEIEMEIIL